MGYNAGIGRGSGGGWGSSGGRGSTGVGITNTTSAGAMRGDRPAGSLPSDTPIGRYVYEQPNGAIVAMPDPTIAPPGSKLIGYSGPGGSVIGINPVQGQTGLVGTTGGTTNPPLAPPDDAEPPPAVPPFDPGIGPSLGEMAPFAAYMKRFNIPGQGGTPFQNWLLQQASPLYGTYQAFNSLFGGESPPTYDKFLSGLEEDAPWDARRMAMDYFKEALGKPEERQRQFQEQLGGDLEDFLRNVLRSTYALPVANRMGKQLPQLQARFLADTGGTSGSFLDYLQQQWGL